MISCMKKLTFYEAAEYLNVKPSTFRNYISLKKIKSVGGRGAKSEFLLTDLEKIKK